MADIDQRLKLVESQIARACDHGGRARSEVLLVAVTKTRPLDDVRTLYELGVRNFAENRVQDVRERIPAFGHPADWHFIGHLQTNKTKYLPGLIDVVHSVDRPEVLDALQKSWEKSTPAKPLRILLEFNIAREAQKTGADIADALALLNHARSCNHLSVEGLMTMAPYSDHAEEARPVFRALRELREDLQQQSGISLPALSMGMSGDFEIAIAEGATIVRIGSALFA